METNKKRYPYYINFIEHYIKAVICDINTPRGKALKKKVSEWLMLLNTSDFQFLSVLFCEKYGNVQEAIRATGDTPERWAKLHTLEKDCMRYIDL